MDVISSLRDRGFLVLVRKPPWKLIFARLFKLDPGSLIVINFSYDSLIFFSKAFSNSLAYLALIGLSCRLIVFKGFSLDDFLTWLFVYSFSVNYFIASAPRDVLSIIFCLNFSVSFWSISKSRDLLYFNSDF